MEKLNKLYGYHSKLKNIFLMMGGVGVFAMMLYITVDVLYRNLSTTALVGTFEVVSYYLMPLTILPSFCLALSAGVMPRIVAIVGKFEPKGQRIFCIVIPVLEIMFYVMMGIFSTKYAISATQDRLTFIAGTKSLPYWFMFFLPPLSYLMMTVESLFVVIKNILDKNANTVLYASRITPEEEHTSI